jgi:hypothetical protein
MIEQPDGCFYRMPEPFWSAVSLTTRCRWKSTGSPTWLRNLSRPKLRLNEISSSPRHPPPPKRRRAVPTWQRSEHKTALMHVSAARSC